MSRRPNSRSYSTAPSFHIPTRELEQPRASLLEFPELPVVPFVPRVSQQSMVLPQDQLVVTQQTQQPQLRPLTRGTPNFYISGCSPLCPCQAPFAVLSGPPDHIRQLSLLLALMMDRSVPPPPPGRMHRAIADPREQ